MSPTPIPAGQACTNVLYYLVYNIYIIIAFAHLPLPLVSGLGNFLVSVAHHGDQHVHQQNGHDYHEHYKTKLREKRSGRIKRLGNTTD